MILHGDCLSHLRTLNTDSLDSMVTDPPAGISFMGKGWDDDKGGRDQWIAWLTEVMAECLRVLKPGAHALVWAIPRTSHWTMTALENAGFEIRDVVTHLFGTGFPKSLDVSKAIDKEAGAKREVVGTKPAGSGPLKTGHVGATGGGMSVGTERSPELKITAPATDAARQWEGFGTALKPACEFWVLARKPIAEKTVAKNVLKYGTGALNIDGCRIGSDVISTHGSGDKLARMKTGESAGVGEYREHVGRFPSNLVLSHNEDCDAECSEGCAVRALDEQSGERKVAPRGRPSAGGANDGDKYGNGKTNGTTSYADTGGASRFFYCAKASKTDRNKRAK